MKIAANAPIGIVGGGAMGRGIAAVAAAAGHPVLIYDADSKVAENAIAKAAASLRRRAEKNPEIKNADEAIARLRAAASLSEFADAAVVIEAVVEDEKIKRGVFCALEEICKPTAILASNTSSLSIARLAAGLREPARMAGMHFFNPPTAMKLVEIVRAQTTSPETADALAALASRWGKTPVVVKDTPGFLANRVARPFYLEALRLLEEGAADVRCIDDCITAAGFPMGPFALMDLIGNDVNLATSESVFRGLYYDPRFRPSPLQREMVDANLLGRKTGAGFYDYKTDPPTPRDFGFETPCYDVHDQKNKPKEVFVYGKSDNLAPIVAALRGKGVKIKKEPPLLADEREICAIFYGNAALAAGGGETADRHSMRVLLDESEIGDIDWPIRNPGIDRDEMWARVEKGELAASPSADNIFVAVDGFADIEAIRNERQMYHPRGFIKFPVDALAIAGPSRAATDAACLLHAAGVKRVYNISDEPGLVVLRTAAMLAAAAINAAKRGIAEYQDKFSMAYPQGLLMEIDEAMCAGFNWPSGPREWGNKLGDYGNRVKETLEGLAEFYGEERYRAALSVYRK